MKDIKVIDILGLILGATALVISIFSIIIAKNIAYTDRKVSTYTDAIVYLDKIAFRSKSQDMGFGDELIKEVDDDWIKEQILVAVDIHSRLEILDKNKANEFWKIVSKIYGKEHKLDQTNYQRLRNDITKELT